MLAIDTPPPRVGPKARLEADVMARHGYCRDLNPTKAEPAGAHEWGWLFDKYGKEGPFGDDV